MTTYEVGQLAQATYRNYDDATRSTLIAPGGGAPTCTVTLPDSSTSAATVTTSATGVYQASILTTLAGRYRFTFSGTGTNSGGLPWSDVADAWPADPRLMISLADAKAALNLSATVTTYDDELRLYIATLTDIIEDITGPILVRAGQTWTANGSPVAGTGGVRSILLPKKPTAITSITENGNVLTSNDYVVDYTAGIIYRGTSVYPLYWWPGLQNIVVTYSVGTGIIPPNVIMGARELLRFLYQNGQQGGARPAFGDTPNYEQMAFTPSGYTVPNRVKGLLSAAETTQVAWFG